MASSNKSPQELAAEIIAAYPFYSNYAMPEKEVVTLTRKAKQLKKEVEELKPYQLADNDLAAKLKVIKQNAIESGVWAPSRGEGSKERLAYAIQRNIEFGYSREEAKRFAAKELAKDGYLAAIRQDRKEKNENFLRPIKDFIKSQASVSNVEQINVPVIDLSRLTSRDKIRLRKDFSTGNFLYHGTETEQLIKILSSGYLANAGSLYEAEEQQAKTTGRETEFIRRNSGFEGISWSLNNIDALPGDRYHLAGLLTAPEIALGKDEQLAIPSRPAISEVIQISASVNPGEFYEAKTQLELYCDVGTFGEANSVFNNLFAVSYKRKNPHNSLIDKPMLYTQGRKLVRRKNYENKLRELYTISDGLIYLSHNLLGQVDDEIPIAAVWLQAAIDTNRLSNTVFAGKDLAAILELMNSKNTEILLKESKKDWLPFQNVMDTEEVKSKHVKVPVESMYLVAAKKDARYWLKVLPRVPHQPKGLILYDDKKVRLENFATLHRGDHAELTSELRGAIQITKGFIQYSEVLGTEFLESMRAGHHHQIIAERYLGNRGIIKWNSSKLTVER